MTASTPSPERVRGFSLIELAVVMFIVAILLGSIVMPLKSQVELRNTEKTQRILDQARDALLGYAAANGYFPCPASSTSNGLEATPNHAAGVGSCAAAVTGANMYYGFLPAATLGFTPVDANGYAVDAWGALAQNRIRYAVSSVNVNSTANCTATPITKPFTAANGMRSATMSCISAATTLLYVCDSGTGVVAGTNCGTAITLASSVPVVIWSVGPNAAAGGGGASVHELQNPNPTAGFSADRIFVSRTKAVAGETVAGGEFDDIVTWIGSPSLFGRLIAAGQLP